MPTDREAADGGKGGGAGGGIPDRDIQRPAERNLQAAAEIGALAVAGCQSLMVEAGAFAQASLEAGRLLLHDLYGARDFQGLRAAQMRHLQEQWERNLAYLKRLAEISEDTTSRMAEKTRMVAPSTRA